MLLAYAESGGGGSDGQDPNENRKDRLIDDLMDLLSGQKVGAEDGSREPTAGKGNGTKSGNNGTGDPPPRRPRLNTVETPNGSRKKKDA